MGKNHYILSPGGDCGSNITKKIVSKLQVPETKLEPATETQVSETAVNPAQIVYEWIQQHRQWYDEHQYYMLLFAVSVIIFTVSVSALKIKFNPHLNNDIALNVWNTSSLKEELQDRIIGQKKALSEILSQIYEPMHTRDKKSSWLKVIFLIGGPSIGKNLAIDIIHQHVLNLNNKLSGDISYVMKFNIEPQLIQNNASNIDFMFIKYYSIKPEILIYAAEKDKVDSELADLIKKIDEFVLKNRNKAILFISSDILDYSQTSSLYDRHEYEETVENSRISILRYLEQHGLAFKTEVISFRPLSVKEVEQCLKLQNLEHGHLIDSINKIDTWFNMHFGFVPQGCRPFKTKAASNSQSLHD